MFATCQELLTRVNSISEVLSKPSELIQQITRDKLISANLKVTTTIALSFNLSVETVLNTLVNLDDVLGRGFNPSVRTYLSFFKPDGSPETTLDTVLGNAGLPKLNFPLDAATTPTFAKPYSSAEIKLLHGKDIGVRIGQEFRASGDVRARFEYYLRLSGIYPKPAVMLRLQTQRETAIISAGSPEEARHWYEWARDLPHSPTRGRFRSVTGYLLNGPSSIDPRILLAYDANGDASMFKVMTSVDCSEVKAAQAVFGGPGIVPSELRSAEHEDGSIFCGLLMPKYERSLADVPELILSEDVLLNRARTLIASVRHVHSTGFVHMDIKEANIFVGYGGNWWLGDFGSAVPELEPIHSTTLGLHPELSTWHLQPNLPALRRYDIFMLAGLLVRQLDLPRDRIQMDSGNLDGLPFTTALRTRAAKVNSDELRSLIFELCDEAEVSSNVN